MAPGKQQVLSDAERVMLAALADYGTLDAVALWRITDGLGDDKRALRRLVARGYVAIEVQESKHGLSHLYRLTPAGQQVVAWALAAGQQVQALALAAGKIGGQGE